MSSVTVLALDRPLRLALIALRMYAGAFWLDKGVRQKLFDPNWSGVNGDCASVIAQMTHGPSFYRAFLDGVVLPNINTFSVMVAWGEALVGASLLLGLFSRAGAMGGLFLALNYWLGNGAGSVHDGDFGFDAATFMMTLPHAVAPTGMLFGVDGLIRRLRAGAPTEHRPA
jgi:thiosulfate dehydrogenase (quinone) large subunit